MAYFRILLAAVMLSTTLTLSFQQPAYAISLSGVRQGATVIAKGVTSKISKSAAGGHLVTLTAESGETLGRYALAPASKQALKNFSPRAIAQSMRAGMQKAGGVAGAAGRIAATQIKRFPNEAFAFFLAIGAITAGQVIFDYANNPVALEQHLNAQKDPVGHLGFLAFMVANGLVSEPLMAAIESKRIRPFIPYMGMAVGMIASNIVHEVGHFPYLQQCIKERVSIGNFEGENCQKAYTAWTEFSFGEKAHEWAPMLMSLFASTFLSGFIHMALVKAAQWTTARIVTVVGIEVLTSFIPGGIFVKGIRFVGKVAQLGMFVGLDMVILPLFTTPYKNMKEGWDIDDLDRQLLQGITRKKDNFWQPETHESCWKTEKPDKEKCAKEFVEVLKNMQGELASWREMNLMSVLMSQSNWATYLSQMSAQYRASKSFYRHFLNELWQKQFGPYKNYIRIIDRIFPLNGVTPANFNEQRQEAFLDDPESIEKLQLDTVIAAVNGFARKFNAKEGLIAQLNQEERAKILEIHKLLRTIEPNKVGEGLQLMNQYIGKAFPRKSSTANVERVLTEYRALFGDPQPFLKPGLGYFRYYEMHPNNSESLKSVPQQRWYSTISTPTLPESMLASMLFGPEVGRQSSKDFNLIRSTSGFKAIFSAPRLAKDTLMPINYSQVAYDPKKFSRVTEVRYRQYSPQRRLGETPRPLSSDALYDYLRKGNIRSDVLNSDQRSISRWWDAHAETEYIRAWVDYEDKYQEVIRDLVKKMWRTESNFWENGPTKSNNDSLFNNSTVANSVVDALRQERKLYLLILGELFKDVGARAGVLNKMMSRAPNAPVRSQGVRSDSLMSALRFNNSLDFSALVTRTTLKTQARAVNRTTLRTPVTFAWKSMDHNLVWQNQILNEFRKLEIELAKIKPQTINKNGEQIEVPVSTAENAQLKSIKESIDQNLNVLKVMLNGTIDPQEMAMLSSGGITPLVNTTEYQKKIIDLCLKGLSSIANEMMTLGLIANSVSYREQHNTEDGYAKPRCINAGATQTQTVGGVRRVLEGCQ
ncbi:MAG: hypothetical protein LW875_03195 [Proteobacteria bacterium]|jgi:hypothetical protein|nr:hypothetical protein [Pseudomonadota bacterium]